MGLRRLEIFNFFSAFRALYTSESDDYRGQIRTFKVDPRSVKVDPLPANSDYCRF